VPRDDAPHSLLQRDAGSPRRGSLAGRDQFGAEGAEAGEQRTSHPRSDGPFEDGASFEI
jgi:hypothetical protein